MATRFFRHRELHVVLLALLAERPMHGYELMGELAERFGGYRPSAGSVYPALESLAAEGLIVAKAGSEPLAYALTATGESTLSNRSRDLVQLEQRTGASLGAVAPVEAALALITSSARSASRVADSASVERLLLEAAAQLTTLANRETT